MHNVVNPHYSTTEYIKTFVTITSQIRHQHKRERVETTSMEYDSTKRLVYKGYFRVKSYQRKNNRENSGDI